jgi:hypothetical protein
MMKPMKRGMVMKRNATTRNGNRGRQQGGDSDHPHYKMNDEEMGSVGRGMATAAQDEEYEKMAQETSMMSLGLQVSFFCSLFRFFCC